jgi:Spy/CpxP family protein refolding chaperone
MRLLRHWKMILGLMAIFGAGVCTGGVGLFVLIFKNITTPVATDQWVDSRLKDLDKRLQLTHEQREKIRPIVADTSARLRAIGGDAYEKIIATAEQAHADVAKELTPEQQKEFNKLRAQVINSLRDLSQREITVKGIGKRTPAMPAPPKAETPQ